MAYQTGTLTGSDTFQSLFNLLAAFAVSEGWTINVSSYPNLAVSDGDCFANIVFNSALTMNDLQGSTASNVSPDFTIQGRLSNAYPAASPLGELVYANDFGPLYSRYWLIGGGAAGQRYIHLVVQRANGRFSFFSFGNLDTLGVTYTGGAYMTGVWWHWGFSKTTPPSSSQGSSEGSDVTGNDHFWFGHSTQSSDRAIVNVSLGALGSNAILSVKSGVTYPIGALTSLTGVTNGDFSMTAADSPDWARWLHPFFYLGPNPVNGVTPLMEVPAFLYVTASQRLQMLGVLPGMRFCSMKGRTEAESVAFADDEYLIVPFKRALPFNPEPWAAKVVTSGPYGMAFLKTS